MGLTQLALFAPTGSLHLCLLQELECLKARHALVVIKALLSTTSVQQDAQTRLSSFWQAQETSGHSIRSLTPSQPGLSSASPAAPIPKSAGSPPTA